MRQGLIVAGGRKRSRRIYKYLVIFVLIIALMPDVSMQKYLCNCLYVIKSSFLILNRCCSSLFKAHASENQLDTLFFSLLCVAPVALTGGNPRTALASLRLCGYFLLNIFQ